METKFSSRLIPLQAGQVITCFGKATSSAERFNVELNSGDGTHNDPGNVQFHMSVRFSGEIVRNAHTRGVGWGHEERHENLIPGNSGNPIRRGAYFKIAIYVDSSMFFVSINDKPYCMFPHRKPLHEVHCFTILRDVESISQVSHTSAEPFQLTISNERNFTATLPKSFKAGSVIVFTATPSGSRGDFAINLKENSSSRVLLHIRPYLGNGTVVINDKDANHR